MTRSAGTGARSAMDPCLVLGRPGSVPFVSDRLAVYV